MKAFACGDVVPGCEARWVCSSEDDILVLVANHARNEHSMAEVPDEVLAQVRSRIMTSV
jgi:predicted small metal-binding protein